MKDDDFYALFNAPMRFDDDEAFQAKVLSGLGVKSWLRQALIVLSGVVGGLYALVQFVRMPGWATPPANLQTLSAADATTDTGLIIGQKWIDDIARQLANVLDASGEYLLWIQSPLFFWLSFSLCMAIIGLYLANSSEEAL